MFGETQTSSGTNLFVVFSVRTVSGPIQHAKSERVGILRIGAIGYSDWLRERLTTVNAHIHKSTMQGDRQLVWGNYGKVSCSGTPRHVLYISQVHHMWTQLLQKVFKKNLGWRSPVETFCLQQILRKKPDLRSIPSYHRWCLSLEGLYKYNSSQQKFPITSVLSTS